MCSSTVKPGISYLAQRLSSPHASPFELISLEMIALLVWDFALLPRDGVQFGILRADLHDTILSHARVHFASGGLGISTNKNGSVGKCRKENGLRELESEGFIGSRWKSWKTWRLEDEDNYRRYLQMDTKTFQVRL